MKKTTSSTVLTLLFLAIFAVTAYAADTASSITSKLNSYKSENGKGVTSYNVNSDEAKICDISFLAMPSEDTDGNFSLYTVKVNGTELLEKISFSEAGWQEAHTAGKAVALNKGDNTITFTSNGRDIPQIKSIDIFKNKRRLAQAPDINSIIKNSALENVSLLENRSMNVRYNGEKRQYRYGVSTNQPYSYTFCMPIYYEAGERFSFYGPTVNDPKYGNYESTVEYNIYLFHENPELFSASQSSSGKYMLQEANIAYSGMYYLLIEAKNQGEWGVVSFILDGKYLNKNVFVSNTTSMVMKEVPMANIYISEKDSCYNIFTVNGRSFDEYHSPDPCLWLKHTDPTSGREIIVAYNDNYMAPSDYDWKANARIREKLADYDYYNVLLSSAFPIPFKNDTCDLYHSFWNTPYYYDFETIFPNSKYEDFIESGSADSDYNCISWTCGEVNTWLWPQESDNDIKWFDKLYNNETVSSAFGNYKRADGSLKYTRQGANAENSAVDIWGIIGNGEFTFTHGSIRKSTDGIPHGYDWESKCGSIQQIFHPRNALRGDGYGQVVANYRIADNQTVTNRSSRSIMAEAIADGELIMENITLTPEEEVLLAEEVDNIPAKKIEKFDELYNKWKSYTDAHAYQSNMFKFKECPEYAELLAYTNSIANGEVLAYDKFIKGNLFVAVLIKDLSDRPDSGTQPVWNSIMDAKLRDNTIRTPRANVTLFIKAVLEKTEASEITEGIKQSNDDDFNVTVSSSQITVDVDLQQAAKYSIQVMNLQNDYTILLSPEKTAEKGKYTHKCDVEPGLYVVTYKLNGNINSKKIVVQ